MQGKTSHCGGIACMRAGPKLKTAMCVLGQLRGMDLKSNLKVEKVFNSKWRTSVVTDCGLDKMMHLEAIMRILKHAFEADAGGLYFDMHEQYFRHMALV